MVGDKHKLVKPTYYTYPCNPKLENERNFKPKQEGLLSKLWQNSILNKIQKSVKSKILNGMQAPPSPQPTFPKRHAT